MFGKSKIWKIRLLLLIIKVVFFSGEHCEHLRPRMPIMCVFKKYTHISILTNLYRIDITLN